MNKMTRTRLLVFALMGIAALAFASVAWAQSAGYGLSWFTVDGGGGTSQGGSYALSGTLGQADAGAMSGGGYALAGGFWGGSLSQFRLDLPLILKSP